jgi:hypothetical protein
MTEAGNIGASLSEGEGYSQFRRLKTEHACSLTKGHS